MIRPIRSTAKISSSLTTRAVSGLRRLPIIVSSAPLSMRYARPGSKVSIALIGLSARASTRAKMMLSTVSRSALPFVSSEYSSSSSAVITLRTVLPSSSITVVVVGRPRSSTVVLRTASVLNVSKPRAIIRG